MPLLASMFYLTLRMKLLPCYGSAKTNKGKSNCLCDSYAKNQTRFGVCAVEEFKLRLILLLSKTLLLEVTRVSEGVIHTDSRK